MTIRIPIGGTPTQSTEAATGSIRIPIRDSASQLQEAYGIPTANTAPLERAEDVPFVPHWAEKMYDDRLLEEEALNKALGGQYKSELFFGDSLRDSFMAVDIGKSTKNQDKIAKFKKAYPDGEITTIPYKGKEILIARKDPVGTWTKFGYATEELVPELASMATAGAVAGEALGTVGGAFLPLIGSNVGPAVGGAIGAGAGFVAGKALDLGFESLRGYGEQDRLATPDTAFGAALNSAFSFLGKGGLVGAAVANAVKPKNIPKRVLEAEQFAQREGLPSIMKGQATSNPQIETAFSQIEAMTGETNLKHIEQNIAATRKYTDVANRYSIDGMDPKKLQSLVDQERYNLNALISGIKSRGISLEQGSLLLQESFQNWDHLVDGKGGYLQNLYKEAFAKSDDIAFDLSDVRDSVMELRQGVVGKGIEREVPSSIVGPDGKPVGTMTLVPEVKITEDPQGALGNAMDALLELDPVITKYNAKDGRTLTSFEQIKELRTRFRRLGDSADPGVSGPAQRVHAMLTQTLRNAKDISGDPKKTADFQAAWTKASDEYRNYSVLSDMKIIGRMQNMQAGDYYGVANNLLIPGKSEALKLIGNVVPDGQKTLRNMFVTKMLAGTEASTWKDTVTKTLDDFNALDKEGLNYLLSPTEQRALRAYATNMAKLEKSQLVRLASLDRTASASAWEAIETGSVEDLKYIVDLAGGKNSPQGQAMVNGILTRLYQRSVTNIPKFGDAFNYGYFSKELQDLKNKGLVQEFLSPQQLDFLENLDKYVDVTKMRVNMGSNLKAGEQASRAIGSIAEIPGAVLRGEGLKEAVKVAKVPVLSAVAGRFLSQPVFSPAGWRAGKKATTVKWLSRVAASMAGQEGAEEEMSYDAAQFNYPGAFPTLGQ